MRSGWMRLVRSAAAMLALAGGLWASGAGAAEVKNVTAKYAWPWGVYINYEVTGTISTNAPLIVTATDWTKNATYYASASALSGGTGTAAGKHQLVWDLDKQGISLQSTNVNFSVMYDWPRYCVVDLSTGANATSYSVTYLDEPPSGGFNTDAYKTTKLVLRRVEAGSFTMGSPSGEWERRDDETQHKVTIRKPYYVGVFEVTQKQYALVMGSNPSNFSGDKRPVEKVSWNTIRGNTNWPASSAVSANSFMGRLRARTGLDFDLPTEAQWEYACRAGTTTAFSHGKNYDENYMWCIYNSSEMTHEVGTKQPNAWGLYDMHGNVREWCLDWYSYLGTAAVTDPKGAASGTGRVIKGGHYGNWAQNCRSAFRSDPGNPSGTGSSLGFRLVRSLPE